MKLLYITNGINGAGGLERVLSIKASYFADVLGYEVTILSLNGTHLNPFYEFSPRITQLSIPVAGNPLKYIQLYRNGIQHVVDHVQPDVISVCDDGLKAFFIPHFLKTSAKIIYERHVSKLIEIREGDSFLKKSITRLKWNLMEKLGAKFDRFVVLTDGNLKEWKGLQNKVVISNPLSFYPEASSTLENEIVICVGKINFQKAQDLLVNVWEKVNQHYPSWQLHLYGKENLAFLDTTNLSHNIHFFPPEKNIASKYLESSIYVMSSRYEGFGMVLTEAMACGVPCVSFDCDYGPSDIIQNNVDGHLVSNGNLDEMAEKLMDLISNPDKRKQFGAMAKQNVQRYSVETIANQWHELFSQLKPAQ